MPKTIYEPIVDSLPRRLTPLPPESRATQLPDCENKVRRTGRNLRPLGVRQVLPRTRPGEGGGMLPRQRPRRRGGHQGVSPRAAALGGDGDFPRSPPLFGERPGGDRSPRPGEPGRAWRG